MKLQIFRLEAIDAVPAPPRRRALEAELGGNVENERDVRPRIAHGDALQALDHARIDVAERALVNPGGVGEAVADDPASGPERGPDELAQVIVTGGGEQNRLRVRTERLGGTRQEDMADGLRARRAARLPRQHDAETVGPQPLGQQRGLGGLAGPLAAFEGYEASSHRWRDGALQPRGAGAEQPHHELARRIEGALAEVAAPDAFGRLQRRLENDVLTPPHLELADRRALFHGGRNRAGVDDARPDLLGGIARNQEPDGPVAGQRNTALGSPVKLRLPDRLVLGEQEPRLERAEAPFEQLAAFLRPLLHRFEAVH